MVADEGRKGERENKLEWRSSSVSGRGCGVDEPAGEARGACWMMLGKRSREVMRLWGGRAQRLQCTAASASASQLTAHSSQLTARSFPSPPVVDVCCALTASLSFLLSPSPSPTLSPAEKGPSAGNSTSALTACKPLSNSLVERCRTHAHHAEWIGCTTGYSGLPFSVALSLRSLSAAAPPHALLVRVERPSPPAVADATQPREWWDRARVRP